MHDILRHTNVYSRDFEADVTLVVIEVLWIQGTFTLVYLHCVGIISAFLQTLKCLWLSMFYIVHADSVVNCVEC